jgi:3-methyladenine DNA glycosylase AlkC
MAQPFKDRFDQEAVARVAAQFAGEAFDEPRFVAAVGDLGPLELKARVDRVADAMAAALPEDFVAAAAWVRARAPRPLRHDEGLSSSFAWWPLLTWVERHGLAHPALALELLRDFTRIFSAEFAIRPYLESDLDGVLRELTGWATDPDPHVRRLVSEGTRPRLPWGRRLRALQADPTRTAPLLDALVDDPDPVVRRSVANHLGDVAKDHPEHAVATGARWQAARADRAPLVAHALRHLHKGGHEGALALLGLRASPVHVALSLPDPEVTLGGSLRVEVQLRADEPGPQRVDLAFRFLGADGQLRPPKVFRWTTVPDATRETSITRAQPLRPVTTRRHYAGAQRVLVQVNGVPMAEATFWLHIPEGA